jgi:hypothetical protein
VKNTEINIVNYIQELLLWHDCVIIPGIGGFVANVSGAQIDHKKNIFIPPFKKLAFNKSLYNNDGLLTNHLASQENVSYREAAELLSNFSCNLNEQLKKGKEIELEGIGKLKPAGPTIIFEPSYDKNFHLDSFGLSEFHSSVIKREAGQKRITKELQDRKSDTRKSSKSNFKKWLIAAAALPAVVILTFSPIQKRLYKDFQTNYTIIIPFLDQQPEYQQRDFNNSKEINFYQIPEESDNIDLASENISKAEINPVAIAESTIINNTIKKFHIIGGCFSVQENAEKFVTTQRQKGYNSEIIDKHKGLLRVSYNSYQTREEAFAALLEIKSHNSSAWILTEK